MKKTVLAVLVVLIISGFLLFNSVEARPRSILVEYRLDDEGSLTISAASWKESPVPKGYVINVFKAPVTVSLLHPGPSEVFMLPLATEYEWVGLVKGEDVFTFVPNLNDVVNISCQKAKARPLFGHGSNGIMVSRGWGVATTNSFSTSAVCR